MPDPKRLDSIAALVDLICVCMLTGGYFICAVLFAIISIKHLLSD